MHPDAARIVEDYLAAHMDAARSGRGVEVLVRHANQAATLGRAFPVFEGLASFEDRVASRLAVIARETGRAPTSLELKKVKTEEAKRQRAAVAGFDVVFAPVKSAAILWALDERAEVRAAVREAHEAARDAALGLLEEHAAYTRSGSRGQAQIETRGLIAAVFDHYDSRAGDPNLHTHVAISSKVLGVDGKWRALDARGLHRMTVAASEFYNTRFETELTARLGVRFVARPDTAGGREPVREIEGVPTPVIEHFSARRNEIEARYEQLVREYRREHTHDPSASACHKLARQANLDTREGKKAPRSLEEMRRDWTHSVSEAFGPGALDSVMAAVPAQTAISVPAAELDPATLAFASDPRLLTVGLGPAGAGKTTAMRAFAGIIESSGRRVIGLGTSAASAAVLGEELGVTAQNLHKFLWEYTQGPAAEALRSGGPVRADRAVFQVRAGDVILLDEAGMAGTLNLDRLVQIAAERGASVRLRGYHRQLGAVEPGGALPLLAHDVGAVELTSLHRFLNPAESAATLQLRGGNSAAIDFDLPSWLPTPPALGTLEPDEWAYLKSSADLIRQRITDLTEQATTERPAWTKRLGNEPDNAHERAAWAARIGAIAAYREYQQVVDNSPQNPVGSVIESNRPEYGAYAHAYRAVADLRQAARGKAWSDIDPAVPAYGTGRSSGRQTQAREARWASLSPGERRRITEAAANRKAHQSRSHQELGRGYDEPAIRPTLQTPQPEQRHGRGPTIGR
jgi:conjugative relaxase-like TrwC/TraI family protein